MMNLLRFSSAVLVAAMLTLCVQPAQCQTDAVAATPTTYYRDDAGHDGYSPTKLPPILSVLWQNTLPGITTAYSTPTMSDGVIYLGAGGHVYALNANDGSIKWQYPADGSASAGEFDSPATVADGKVFVGSNSNLSVFDEASGSLLWQVNTTGYNVSAPLVENGNVFFGSSDKHLYAIKEADQQPLWGGVFRTGGPVFSSPCVGEGMLWFSDGDGGLYGVKENTGALQWTFLPNGGVSAGSPVYRNGIVYASSGTDVISLFFRSGALKDSFQLPSIITGPPTIDDTNIFVSTSDSDIYCLSLRGATVWKTHLQDVVTVPMQITDSYLYAESRSGVLYAIDPSNGKIVWSYALQQAIVEPGDTSGITKDTMPQARSNAGFIVQNGKLIIFCNDGTVTAFSGTAPDHIAPQALALNPQPDSTVAGANLQFQIFVTDIGSGIDPSTVSLKIDGAQVPVTYDPTDSMVSLQLDKSKNNSIGRIVLPTLPDGQRTAELNIADWRGNTLDKKWSFTVDNTLDPEGSPPPSPIQSNTFNQLGAAPGSPSSAGSITYSGPTTPNSDTAPASGSAGSSSGGIPAPIHNLPPTPPPGGGGGGNSSFPPPPPI